MLQFAPSGVRGWVLMLALVAPWVADAAPKPESPRPQSWVRDDAGMLAPAAEQRIDAAIDLARSTRPVELAVVTMADAGTDDTRRYATELFNAWGIGDPQLHDGVLVFIAREQRAAEIILGEGIDSDAEVATSQRIMDAVLVPAMRRGDPEDGLLATVEAVLQQIHGIAPPALENAGPASPMPAASAATQAEPLTTFQTLARSRPLERWLGAERETTLRQWAEHPGVQYGTGFGAVLLALGLRWWWRVRGRRCPRCHAALQRLDEVADDAHLQPAQRLEEQLGSVDYDVWACSACSFVDTRRYGAWFTRYARCGQCRAVALERAQTTLAHATYEAGGRVRVDERCRHCGHQHSYERTTPRRTRSSGGGSGRKSGFSGGRSRGRGASGRW